MTTLLLRGRRRRFAQSDGELGLTGLRGIVESVADPFTFVGFEEQSAFDAVGQAGEAGFAIDICADLEIELVGAHKSVGDVDFDLGQINWLVVSVSDGEIGSAGTKTSVDDRYGFGVRSLGQGWDSQEQGS